MTVKALRPPDGRQGPGPMPGALLRMLDLALVRRARGKDVEELPPPRPRPGLDYAPGVGDDAQDPRDSATRTVEQLPPLDAVDASETPLPPAPNGAEGWDEHTITVR